MRKILQAISGLSLAGTILPAVMFYFGKLELPATQTAMLVTTIVWFAATSMWMGRENDVDEKSKAEEGRVSV